MAVPLVCVPAVAQSQVLSNFDILSFDKDHHPCVVTLMGSVSSRQVKEGVRRLDALWMKSGDKEHLQAAKQEAVKTTPPSSFLSVHEHRREFSRYLQETSVRSPVKQQQSASFMPRTR